jgi:hypothetical protein
MGAFSFSAMKKRFFIEYVVRGRTYYRDQDGKRASKDKVKRAKRKVFIEVQKGAEKGIYERKKASTTKEKNVLSKSKDLSIFGHKVQGELTRAKQKGIETFLTIDGKTYKITSEQAKQNLFLFNHEFNQLVYKRLKKNENIDSFYFDVSIKENKKTNQILFDFDALDFHEDEFAEFPDILKTLKDLRQQSKELFKKYFKK